MAELLLPNGWEPRAYQVPLWRYLQSGGKRALALWHRRAGKDDVCMHWAACSAVQRVGNYWHMLPEAAQARKAIWEAVNPHTGKRRIDEAFPKALRQTTREQEMMIRFKNGSTWQVVGSDNFNSLVGSPPVGVVFSEWALAHPAAWAYIRPILAENGGWALFITTPRGRNHAYTMYQGAKDDPSWYAERLAATDTGVFTQAQLDAELAEYTREYGAGNGESLFRQEYLVSFDAAILGAYWGKEIADAERQGRVKSVPVDPLLPVHTVWDLGVGDSTSIWFFQVSGSEIRVVDHYENHGQGLPHYAEILTAKGYRYGDDWVPHDAKVRELGTGRTRVETLSGLGRKPRLVPDHKLMDGINAARQTLPLVWFDEGRTRNGVEALRQYRAEYDEKTRAYKNTPKHDWTSHAADAFRYLSMAWREIKASPPPEPGRILAVGPANRVTLNDLWSSQPSRHKRI